MTETESLWTKNFIILALANFLLFVAFQMLIPTLPLFVTQRGGDQVAVGLVISIFTVSALLIRPFAGKALDSIGRKPVLLGGLFIFFLSVSGYYWMATVALVLLVRFVHGIGWGIATTAFGTIASDLIPARRRGEGMGYFGMFGNLAMALGPMFGLWLVSDIGYGWMFAISAILTIAALLMTRLVGIREPDQAQPASKQAESRMPRTQGQSTAAPAAKSGSLMGDLVEQKALFPSLLALYIGITYGGIVSFITLFGKEAGIGQVGLFFLFNAVFLMAVRPFAGKLFDRKGHVWVLIPGALLAGVGLLVLSYISTAAGLAAAAALFGAGFGAVQPSLQAWTINRVPPHRRGAANGTFFSAFDLGIGLGAMLLGAVAKVTGFSLMYRYSALIIALFLLSYLIYLARGGDSRENQEERQSA
ncbi:MFS transporter [Brevibacillus composti]|uniref:MFS transporter n=1 Tax=Brevibacillus composti TaxID=2796470 RepID=A0A7T5JNX2_9BACL|nr:MFS transporter [Brevibacillus composti]QQE74475.1 MFS transporter [Brevibacillus composti]QUO41557.1 MFS transporter [Brevibacillus composti]